MTPTQSSLTLECVFKIIFQETVRLMWYYINLLRHRDYYLSCSDLIPTVSKISDVQLTKCVCVFVCGQVCVTACQCQRSSLSERKRRRTAADEETMATGKRSKREKGRTAGRPSQVNTHGNTVKYTSGITSVHAPENSHENTLESTRKHLEINLEICYTSLMDHVHMMFFFFLRASFFFVFFFKLFPMRRKQMQQHAAA